MIIELVLSKLNVIGKLTFEFTKASILLVAAMASVHAQQIEPLAGRLDDTTEGCRVWLPFPFQPLDPVVWTGSCQEGLAEGPGVIEYGPAKGRTTFEGILSGGNWSGPGTIKYPDGRRLSSTWMNNRRDMNVVYARPDGSSYRGNWNRRPDGSGIMVWADGASYSGSWVSGQPSGDGEMRLPDGYMYKGSFANGKFAGRGVLKAPDGRMIDGVWRDNDVVEDAIVTDGHGDVYEGSIQSRQRSGNGTFKWADGRKYSGQWVNNLPHGSGEYVDGAAVFTGSWHKGCLITATNTIALFVDPGSCDKANLIQK